MNRVALAGIALVAAGVAAWLAFGARERRATTPETTGEGRPPDAAPLAPPGLAKAPDEGAGANSRGRSTITGVVRRDGRPTAARVELRFVEEPREEGRVSTNASLLWSLAVPKSRRVGTLTTAAGPDGRYAIEGLAAGVWRVAATADDGATGEAEVSLGADGARVEADVVIGLVGETLAGRVVYADGRAFSGVVFVSQRFGGEVWESRARDRVALDATGKFLATGLAVGDAVVTAIEDGVLLALEAVPVPFHGEYVLTVDEGTTVREGRVVAADEGSPIAGASVLGVTMSSEGRLHLARTQTDAAGGFRIALPRGEVGLSACARGYAPSNTPVDASPLGSDTIVIRLARGARLTGRVTAAADGKPVVGVSVCVFPEEGGFDSFPHEPAISDADGRYVVEDLPAGDAVAIAEGEGWVTKGLAGGRRRASSTLATTLVAGTTATFDIQVVRAVSATGVVLDATGAPVAGAVVRAQGRESPTSYWIQGLIENARVEPTATAADGTFAVSDLVGGATYVFTATAPDGTEGNSGFVRPSDEAPNRVEIRFVAERRIEVSVVAADTGAPIEGAQVAAEPFEPALVDAERVYARTEENGRATLVVRCAGDLRLDVRADGWRRPLREIVVAAAATSAEVRLERGFLVTGRVLMPDGSPAGGVTVCARSEEGDPREDPGEYSVYADGRGAFRMTFNTRGPRTLRAKRVSGEAELAAVAVVEAGGEPVTLTLAPASEVKPPPGTLVVRVVDPDGKPVPRARVRFERGRYGTDKIGGRVEFHLRPGEEAWVCVSDAESAEGEPLPLGPALVGPLTSTTDEVVVRLPPEMTVEGVVRGPDGKGVPGLVVTAMWGGGDPHSCDGSTLVRTGADGTFRIGRLGEGPCSLAVDVPPEFVRPESVPTRGGAKGIEFTLARGMSVTVTVVDEEGKAVPGASVSATPAAPGLFKSADEDTDEKGVARLAGLDASVVHRLSVDPPRERRALLARSQQDWKPADTTVRLQRSLSVSGVVRDPSGKPVEGAEVSYCDENGCFAPVTTRADGTFTIPGLGGGEIALYASIEGRLDGPDEGTRVSAGSEGVVLVLDPGLELVVRVADWKPGEWRKWAQLYGRRGLEPVYASVRISPDGTLRFRGLEASDTLVLWIPPTEDGRSLLKTDVRAASNPLTVTRVPGKSIRVRLTVPEGARLEGVTASWDHGHVRVSGTVRADGTYEIAGLPDGMWTIHAHARKGNERLSAEAEVPAGGTGDLLLK